MKDQLRIDGLTIAYERAGQGPPVLFLHGGLSDSREWRHQLDALRDEFTVVAWDAPGCGQSSDPHPSCGMAGYAEALAGLVHGLNLGPVHAVGISFGSTVALELYRLHPELVRSLTLAGGYAGWAGSLSAEEVARRVEGALGDLESSPEELARSWAPTLFSANAPSEAIEELTEITSSLRTEGARTMVEAMAGCDLRPFLPGVALPTLVLHGDEDVRSSRAVAEALAAAIPRASLVIVEGVGHMSNLESPERFTAELRAFLRRAEESPQ